MSADIGEAFNAWLRELPTERDTWPVGSAQEIAERIKAKEASAELAKADLDAAIATYRGERAAP